MNCSVLVTSVGCSSLATHDTLVSLMLSPPTFSRFLFHSNSSPFAHVLSLCFKTLRVAMRKVSLLQPLGKKLMQFNFRLDCMPAAPFDMEKMVMLVNLCV